MDVDTFGGVRSRLITAVAAALAVSAAAGCSTPAPYQERMDYLRVVAQRGADTHTLLEAQGAAIDKKRCEAAYAGLDDGKQPYAGVDNGAYVTQVEQFFVDSCITGKPKPVPGQSPAPSGPASVPASVSVSPATSTR